MMMIKHPLTAWWETIDGEWLHVHNLIENQELRKRLPLLDQLALALELEKPEVRFDEKD